MVLENIAKSYDDNVSGIRAQDQSTLDSPPDFPRVMFSKNSNWNKQKKVSLVYQIPNSLDSGFLKNFGDSLDVAFKNRDFSEEEQLRIFGISYFTCNVLKLIHPEKINLENLLPQSYIAPISLDKKLRDYMSVWVTQDFVEATAMQNYLQTRYNIDLNPAMVKFPLFDGESSFFCHDIAQIVNLVYLAPKAGEKSKIDFG